MSTNEYQRKLMSAADAVKLVRSGDRVYAGVASSVAFKLLEALYDRRDELQDVEISVNNILRSTPITNPGSPFVISSPFLGPGERTAVKNGVKVKYTSFHLSQVHLWVRDTARPTVAFLEVSPPDEHGYMSYGASGGSMHTFVRREAERIILQVNKNVPYVTGEDCLIHASEVDAVVEADDELPTITPSEPDEISHRISEHVLKLVPDGATIQLGIGGLSAAVGYGLRQRNDLGVYTEMLNEPILDLILSGNVTNTRKGFMDGKTVFGFAVGSRKLYDYLDHNPDTYCLTFPEINEARSIAHNNHMISINTAMAFDLYGQVAADSMGWKQQSGVGGQMDFVKGAQWSPGGKSIIASASSFMKNGVRQSKISLTFPAGTAVTTPRSEVQYVATEYGCVNLKALTMDDRVRAMISLAHPDFRDQLTDQAKEHHLI